MYSAESKGGIYPELHSEPGRLSFVMEEVYPEYLVTPTIFMCPASSKRKPNKVKPETTPQWYFDDHSYWYLGARVWNEESGRSYIKAYRERMDSGVEFGDWRDPEASIMKEGNRHWNPGHIIRLRKGRLRGFSSLEDSIKFENRDDSEKKSPIMIERPENHGGRSNVLFMDGHVENMAYPGKFPMTEEFIGALRELDALGD